MTAITLHLPDTHQEVPVYFDYGWTILSAVICAITVLWAFHFASQDEYWNQIITDRTKATELLRAKTEARVITQKKRAEKRAAALAEAASRKSVERRSVTSRSGIKSEKYVIGFGGLDSTASEGANIKKTGIITSEGGGHHENVALLNPVKEESDLNLPVKVESLGEGLHSPPLGSRSMSAASNTSSPKIQVIHDSGHSLPRVQSTDSQTGIKYLSRFSRSTPSDVRMLRKSEGASPMTKPPISGEFSPRSRSAMKFSGSGRHVVDFSPMSTPVAEFDAAKNSKPKTSKTPMGTGNPASSRGFTLSFLSLGTEENPVDILNEILVLFEKPWKIFVSGFFIALAVLAMHYLGMYSMRMEAEQVFNPVVVGLSVVIAFVAATAGMFIIFRILPFFPHDIIKYLAAVIIAIAVNGMHYTGMAAVEYKYRPNESLNPAGLIEPYYLAE
ncbi:UNVERIFIED_CONTAM: hypothetical protein HDU68_004642, partial [Siphonaria sp. JEL0065]